MDEKALADLVVGHVIDVPDFPHAGILFKDITPLFGDGPAFRQVVDGIVDHHGRSSFDLVAGVEARGFLIAGAIGYATGAGVLAVRKAGKLPREVLAASYALEYGEATLEVHRDAVQPGQRVLVVDDVLATGGTAEATLSLIEQAGGMVTGFSVLIELAFLHGRDRLAPRDVHALLTL